MSELERRRPGERAGLTREAILEATHECLLADGIEGVSMRSVATALGVAPNALYSHFANKAEIIDAFLDHLLQELDYSTVDGEDWQQGLFDLMSAMRRFLLSYPDLIPYYLSRPTQGPNATRLGETTLGFLERGGIRGEAALEALQVLLIYTIGFAAQEAPRLAEANPDLAQRMRSPAASYPVSRVFDTGLDWLIDGVSMRSRA